MDILFARGNVSAQEIQERLPDPPSYSTVRTLLRILERKGHVQHSKQGAVFIYAPTQPKNQAACNALAQVVKTFFGSSVENMVATLLSSSDTNISDEELDRISALIDNARSAERDPSVASTDEFEGLRRTETGA